MDSKFVKEDGVLARSFRYEDYNTRRVFLRSYPLQWGEESEETKEERPEVEHGSKDIKPMKKMIVSVVEWSGGKILILRRFQHKIAIYVIACLPASFKPPTARISS